MPHGKRRSEHSGQCGHSSEALSVRFNSFHPLGVPLMVPEEFGSSNQGRKNPWFPKGVDGKQRYHFLFFFLGGGGNGNE